MTNGLFHTFGKSQNLRGAARGLRAISSELHEISMNAALNASNSRSSHSVFAVMAREIGRISKAIDVSLNEIDEVTSKVSNSILQSVQVSESIRRLTMGADLGVADATRRRIDAAAARGLSDILECVEKASFHLSVLIEQIDWLDHIFSKDEAIVINIKITCQLVTADESRVYLAIADVIHDLNARAASLIAGLRVTIREMAAYFEQTQSLGREHHNAA